MILGRCGRVRWGGVVPEVLGWGGGAGKGILRCHLSVVLLKAVLPIQPCMWLLNIRIGVLQLSAVQGLTQAKLT